MRQLPKLVGAIGICLLAPSSAFAQAYVNTSDGSGTTSMQQGVAVATVYRLPVGDPNLQPNVTSGEASADLTAGTMRAYSRTVGNPQVFMGPVSGIFSAAGLNDTITIAGAPGMVPLTTSLAVDGRFTDNMIATGARSVCRVTTYLAIGDTLMGGMSHTSTVTGERDELGGQTPTYLLNGPAADITQAVKADNFSYTHTTSFMVPVGMPVTVSSSLEVVAFADSNGDVFSDFGNTARLSITLPSGYKYTSASGQLLTDPGAPGLNLDGSAGGPSDAGTSSSGDLASGAQDLASGATDGGVSSGADAGAASSGSKGGCDVASPLDPTMFGLGAATLAAIAAFVRGRRRRQGS